MQLKHLPTEASREAHGEVRIISSSGEILAENLEFQHNRNYHAMGASANALVEAMHSPTAVKAATVETVGEGDVGSSTQT